MIRVVGVKIKKLPDDPLGLRISAGGHPEVGFYLRYRGEDKLMEELLGHLEEQMMEFLAPAERKTDFTFFAVVQGNPFFLTPFRKPAEPTDTPDMLSISAGLQKDRLMYVKYQGPMADIIQLFHILNEAFKRRNEKKDP